MALSFTHISPALIVASWLLFILSFFLPATNVLQMGGTPLGTPLTGWQAFTTSVSCGAMNPWMWIAEPRVFFFLIFPWANGLMLFAPMISFMLREKAAALAFFLVPCAIVPWCMPRTLLGDLFAGFYCWNGSFIAMSIGCILASLAYDSADNHWYSVDGSIAEALPKKAESGGRSSC